MFFPSNDERGITLIELLVALALTGIVLTGLMSVYWSASYAFEREYSKSDTQYSARQAKERISNDLRESKSFLIQDGGQKLHLVKDGEEVDYYVNNQQLYRDSSNASPSPVVNNIESITFSGSVPGLLEVTVAAKVKDNEYSLTFACKSRID